MFHCSRISYTDDDDEHLCHWVAQKIPYKDQGGRTGNVIWQQLAELVCYIQQHFHLQPINYHFRGNQVTQIMPGLTDTAGNLGASDTRRTTKLLTKLSTPSSIKSNRPLASEDSIEFSDNLSLLYVRRGSDAERSSKRQKKTNKIRGKIRQSIFQPAKLIPQTEEKKMMEWWRTQSQFG